MATIQSSLTLTDRVSARLGRMSQAADTLLGRFGALDNATERFDPQMQWQLANSSLLSMADNMERLVQLTQQSNEGIENISTNMSRARTSSAGLVTLLKQAVETVGSLAAVKKVFDLSDTLTRNSARITSYGSCFNSTIGGRFFPLSVFTGLVHRFRGQFCF